MLDEGPYQTELEGEVIQAEVTPGCRQRLQGERGHKLRNAWSPWKLEEAGRILP